MAIEPQPAPQQLVLPTFKIIGRPPALLARFQDNADANNPQTPATLPENMSLDAPNAHSPKAEASGTPDLLSRITNTRQSVSGSSTVPNAPTSLSPQAAISPLPDPPAMTPVIASADIPVFSPVTPGFDKTNAAAPSTSTAGPSRSNFSPVEAMPQNPTGDSTTTPPPNADFEFSGFLNFIEKRSQSLSGVHDQNATRARDWVKQARTVAASGDRLLEFVNALIENADAAAAQAVRVREEAVRAEELAINLQARAREGLSLVEGLQKEHASNRDLAEKVQRYSERLKAWDLTTGEKEKKFTSDLRSHLQTEEAERSRRADEVTRREAERAADNAARTQREAERAREEAARAAERSELVALRAELEASKKRELFLSKQNATLLRANSNFLASIEGLRSTVSNTGTNNEAMIALDESASLASIAAQPTSPVAPSAPTSASAATTTSQAANASHSGDAPSGSTAATQSPASSISAAALTLGARPASPAARQTASPAQVTSRPLVSGFVPAQTEAGRAVDTQRPLSSTIRASASRSAQPSPDVQRSSPAAIPVRDSSAAVSVTPSTFVSPEVVVKQEPEPDTELSQSTSPPIPRTTTNAPTPTVQPQRTAPPVASAASPLVVEKQTPMVAQPSASSTSTQAPSASHTAPTAVAKKPQPPPIREPEPLREPSPMGPGYDGGDHMMMPPEHDYDMDDRRSYDSHPETNATDRPSPITRNVNLGLPPKPRVFILPPRNEHPDQPMSSMNERASASQSPVERVNTGSVNKRKIDRKRNGMPGTPQNANNDPRPPNSSVPAKRPPADDGPRPNCKVRRRVSSGPSRPLQAGIPPAGDSYVPSQDVEFSPPYERDQPYPPPRQGGSSWDPRSGIPPSSSPNGDGWSGWGGVSPPYNARPQVDSYRPPDYFNRGLDHYSPAPPIRDRSPPPLRPRSPPPQRRPSRSGDSYRPGSPPPMEQRQRTGDFEDRPRRNLPPHPPAPDDRQPVLQARISAAHTDERSGPAPSESRPSLEERMQIQTVPVTPSDISPPYGGLASRIGSSPTRGGHGHTDNAGEPRRQRGGRGRGAISAAARGRGGSTATNSRGRGRGNAPAAHRRNASTDESPGNTLLGRIRGV